MLGLVDSFFDRQLAFLWEQTVPHYWLTCFSIPMRTSFQINSLRRAKESLLESSIPSIVILMTLSLSIIKDLMNSSLISTPKNSPFLRLQNLLQLLLISTHFFTKGDNNNINTKLDDKRDAFGFHIVNFPFMSSNIPSAPTYGVYESQFIRYARCCSNYSDFLSCHRALVTRRLSQGYKINHLSNTFNSVADTLI